MSRIIYVNGRYLPYAQAAIHAEDRGFQFADAVYEVCEVQAGQLVDEARHLSRLERSLGELGMVIPMSRPALQHVLRETIRRNRVRNGVVYLQVTRGAGPREFVFPGPDVAPTVVCIARSARAGKVDALAEEGIAVKTMPDIRWQRCDIKTVMLLPACLAKQAAREEGAREAWFVDEAGFVTEGASSNAWIVTEAGLLITRPADAAILSGVTRATIKDLIGQLGLELQERAFSVSEALVAREAFVSSASNTVMPVVRIDARAIADGRPGPITRLLRSKFYQAAEISI